MRSSGETRSVHASIRTRSSHGRPKDLARRIRIAREALAAFADGGYAGTTMREIAERSGIAETQLYRDFSNKERLFTAALDYVEERQGAVLAAIALAASSTERMRPFLERAGLIVQRYVEEMAPWYALRLGRPPLSEARRAHLIAGEEAFVREIEATLERRGAPRTAYRTASLLVRAIVGEALLHAGAGHPACARDDRTLFVSDLVATVSGGLANGSAASSLR